jgi:hypothetical protein
MNTLYDITWTRRSFSPDLFSYPCVDPNTPFLKDKNVTVFQGENNALGKRIERNCAARGAYISNALNETTDILIINTPLVKYEEEHNTTEKYYDILFHYIKPAQRAIPFMRKKRRGHIVFVLPPHATVPSVEYGQIAAFAAAGLAKGLAMRYAPAGIVINGIVLGDSEDYDAIAEWIVFLASGNAGNIIGELIILD